MIEIPDYTSDIFPFEEYEKLKFISWAKNKVGAHDTFFLFDMDDGKSYSCNVFRPYVFSPKLSEICISSNIMYLNSSVEDRHVENVKITYGFQRCTIEIGEKSMVIKELRLAQLLVDAIYGNNSSSIKHLRKCDFTHEILFRCEIPQSNELYCIEFILKFYEISSSENLLNSLIKKVTKQEETINGLITQVNDLIKKYEHASKLFSNKNDISCLSSLMTGPEIDINMLLQKLDTQDRVGHNIGQFEKKK